MLLYRISAIYTDTVSLIDDAPCLSWAQ